jgi:Tfp pilus assembly protein PilO
MSFWTGKKRTLLQIDMAGLLICIAASLVTYFTQLKPLIEQSFFLASQRRDLAVQRQESSKLGASMRTLDNQLVVVKEKLTNSQIKLESSDRINQRVAELTSLFNDSALEVDDVQTGNITVGLKYDLVPINIAGRGGYKQCVVFLDELHQTFADISIAGLELTRPRFLLSQESAGAKPKSAKTGGKFNFQLFWHTTGKDKM